MHKRIEDVRVEQAQAVELVCKLGKISDDAGLTSVRKALYTKWTEENKKAIMRAIFTAWRVNYQKLASTGQTVREGLNGPAGGEAGQSAMNVS